MVATTLMLLGSNPAAASAAGPESLSDAVVSAANSSRDLTGTAQIAAYQRAARSGLAHPLSCPTDPGYSYSGLAASTISAVRTLYGDPGVHLAIALQAGASATAQVGALTQAGASVVIANASVAYNISFALTITATVTYTGDWTVPLTVHVGWLGAGAYADRYNWSYGRYLGCRWVVSSAGVITAPYRMPYIWKGYQ